MFDRPRRLGAGGAARPVILGLVLLDQPLHLDGVALCDGRGSGRGRCRRLSIMTSEKNRFVSISTDATWAMWIDCSRRPNHCGVNCTTLAGVMATCVGNRRLPRLQRLARKTCSPGSWPTLYQNEGDDRSPPQRDASSDDPEHHAPGILTAHPCAVHRLPIALRAGRGQLGERPTFARTLRLSRDFSRAVPAD